MHFNGTSALAERTDSPLVAGARWFETEGRPFELRMALPLSYEEMVAALYGDNGMILSADPGDLSSDEDVFGHIALVVTQDGMNALRELAAKISADEHAGRLAAPQWLALCRRRVAKVINR